MTKMNKEKMIEINAVYKDTLETKLKPMLLAGLNFLNWKLAELNGDCTLPDDEKALILQKSTEAQDYWNKLMSRWENYELLDVILNFDNPSHEIENSLFKDDEVEPHLPYITREDIDKMTLEEALNHLLPPAYVPSEEEIILRAYGYLFEDTMFEFMYDINEFTHYCKDAEGKTKEELNFEKEHRVRSANYYRSYVNKLLSPDSEESSLDSHKDMWKLVDREWFNRCYVEGLSDSHCGDCTAVACSCIRCHSESLFKIPQTSIWDKHTGSYLDYKHRQLSEAKKS